MPDVSAILRDARKIGDMLEVDDAESSPLVGYRHHPESSCNVVDCHF